MKRDDFLNLIIKTTNISSSNINEQTELASLKEWDSLAFLGIIALYHNTFKFRPAVNILSECKTIKEILDLGNDYYEK